MNDTERLDPAGPSNLVNPSSFRLLIEAGTALAREPNPQVIFGIAAESGREITGATFAACLSTPEDGFEAIQPGISAAAPLTGSQLTASLAEAQHTLPSDRLFRSADILTDEHGRSFLAALRLPDPFPARSLLSVPARSLLSVPARDRSGRLLARLLFGHRNPDAFSADTEFLAASLAGQVAAALESLRLAAALSAETARANSERRLHVDTSRRLRLALEAGGLGTWSWHRDTDLLDLDEHAAALLRVDPHQPITRTALREHLVDTEDRPAVREKLVHSLATGAPYTAEYRINTPDGARTWVASSALHLRDPSPDGGISGMVGIVQDITARKVQEAILRQSEKLAATGRLAASIAHEINNPLEAVTNLVYLARTDPDTPEAVRQQLQIADDEVARVSQIAQQTLGFYRDTTRPVDIDLNDLLFRVVDLFARRLSSKKLDCTLDLAPDLRIFGLAGEVRQVFSNLLVNAIDASADGTIHLRGRHCRNGGCHGVSVLVADQGVGIPPGIRSRLFSPFFTTKESVGTGLGLWVTRGIVEKGGGAVTFRSCTANPSGTVFRVFLPARIHPAAVGAASPDSLQ